MTTITFDTHKFIRTLKEAGVPESQAEAFSDAFKDAQGEAEIATQYDIKDVRRDITDLRTEINGELKLLRWMVGMSIALSTGTIALLAKLFFILPH